VKPFRVLLVDDSAPFRRQVGSALEASGLSVVEATEGFEAMWRARADATFDLVLLDIHMPSLDGLTFMREVRKLPGYADVPIIVLTSDGSRERRLEGRAAGATAWLLKPPDLPGLINAVHSALLRPDRPSEAEAPRRSGAPPSRSPPELRSRPAPAASRPPLAPPRSERSAPGAARPSSLAPASRSLSFPPDASRDALASARLSSLPAARVSAVPPGAPRRALAPESSRRGFSPAPSTAPPSLRPGASNVPSAPSPSGSERLPLGRARAGESDD
jgi:two-component system chemotaxis response regulator CheY